MKPSSQNRTIKIACISLVLQEAKNTEKFIDSINSEIRFWPGDLDIAVFPEYCWGDLQLPEIRTIIDKFDRLEELNTLIVFGTAAFVLENGVKTNNAIIRFPNGEFQFISKQNVLEGEQRRNEVQGGKNQGIIRFKDLKIGIMICADAWYAPLFADLVLRQEAEIIIIPAFTVVPKGLSSYAKIQWYALTISRSREFTVPIAISDHNLNGNDYEVGKVTAIIDPSRKNPGMKEWIDFIEVKRDKTLITEINLSNVKEYRDYRVKYGLLQMW